MRGAVLSGALVAGASFACGSDGTGRTAVTAARHGDDAEHENAGEATAADAAAPVECPPTRIISDVSDVPKATVSGAAVNIMVAYCSACHAPDAAEPAPSGPANAADFNGMIDEGLVADCDAERSVIIRSMRQGGMPPPEYFGVTMSPGEIDLVATFIELDCSDAENACAESPGAPGCDEVLAVRRARRCAW